MEPTTVIHDEQRAEWFRFVREQHKRGKCEFSGMGVSACVACLCDCFETPEGAARIEAGNCGCEACL